MRRGMLLCAMIVVLVLPVVVHAQARMISLQESIDAALERSTFVRISQEQLIIARQNVLRNYAGFLPDARISAYAGHRYIGPTNSVAFDTSGRPVVASGFDFESYNFSINSAVNLFDWGVSFKNLSSSKSSANAAEHDLQYQKDLVIARVIREYYNLVRNKNLTKVQEESVVSSQRNLDQVEAFFRIGSNTKADVLQAKVNLGNNQVELIQARNAELIARAQLASTLNIGLEEELDVDPALGTARIDLDIDAEVDFMLQKRSDLLAGRQRVDASKSNLTAAKNSRLPTLAASVNYGWNDRLFPDGANFFRNEYSWSVGLSLNYNIFDRFQTKSNIINAQAQQRVAEYNLQQAKLDAVLELKTLYQSLLEADERIRVSTETVEQARENLRLAEERYRVGAGTILETIEARVQLTTAQSSLIQAQIDYSVLKADLKRAAGRRVTVD